jgi:hypothetical protein
MLPNTALPKRRLQIVDDETRDGPRIDAAAPDANEDIWVTGFIARLAASIRGIGRNN